MSLEIARWLERGLDVNARASRDAEGFGGYTALFGTVVSQPNFWVNLNGEEDVAPLTKLLLEHGADPNARGSIKKQPASWLRAKVRHPQAYEIGT